MVDEDGSELIYDPSSIAHKNPFRYRGYYYDRETGFYYLNARYYDPQIGRFICPDDISYLDPTTINGLNLYAYCGNNPVMYSDPSGHIAITTFLIGMGIAALIGAGVGAASYVGSEVVSYILTGEWSWSWGMFAGSVLGGGISGALSVIPGVGPVMTAFVSGGASCAIGMSLQNAFGESNYSAKEIVGSSILSAGVSALCAGLIKGTPIQGFNAGRGSLQQVSKQITTKFFNGQIKRISLSTVGKLISYNLAYSSLGSFSSGIVDTIQSYYTKPKNYPTVPAWFC